MTTVRKTRDRPYVIKGQRCTKLNADGSHCRKAAYKDGLCNIHYKKMINASTEVKEAPMENSETQEAVVKTETPFINDKNKKYQLAAQKRKEREKRIKKTGALHGQKLYASQQSGFYRRWVNDEGNRLAQLEEIGYSFVSEHCNAESTDIGSRVSQRVGVDKNGDPIFAYLMEIPEEFHQQDQAAKEQKIRKTEKGIRRANAGGGIGQDKDRMYYPGHNNAFLED